MIGRELKGGYRCIYRARRCQISEKGALSLTFLLTERPLTAKNNLGAKYVKSYSSPLGLWCVSMRD